MALSYIRIGEYAKAKLCLDEYRKKAGVFDNNGNIKKGLEIYYETVGEYYLGINQLDSAEYYFRKTLTNKDDGDCQEGGHRGLYLLYKRLGNKDSLAKYADLSYQINDKRILDLSTREIQNMQQLYNYTRNQEIAKQEQKRAGKMQFFLVVIGSSLLVCLLLIAFYYKHVRVSRKIERMGYEKKLEILQEAKQKQKLLLDNQIEQMTKETNEQIVVLTKQLDEYQKEKNLTDKQMKEDELQASVISRKFHEVGNGRAMVELEDWDKIENLLYSEFPVFKQKIMAHKQSMMPDDYQLCLLSRLHFAPYEIANILHLKSSNVTMKRKRMLKLLFGKDGNAKLFDELLQKLCWKMGCSILLIYR